MDNHKPALGHLPMLGVGICAEPENWKHIIQTMTNKSRVDQKL